MPWHMQREICELTNSEVGEKLSAHECAMMTESADVCFSEPGLCWYIELFEFFVDPSAI